MLKKLLLLSALIIPAISFAQNGGAAGTTDGIGIEFYDRMLKSYSTIDNQTSNSSIGKISPLQNFTSNQTPFEQRVRPNVPWTEKLKYEDDKVKVDEEAYISPPVRTRVITFPGPTKGLLGAAHSPLSSKLINEMLKGPTSLMYIAMQQTDPAIGSGLDMAEKFSQNMVDRAATMQRVFLEGLDGTADGARVREAYFGCIQRHMNADEYPEVVTANAATPNKDPNKTWLQAVHFCLNDSLYHQGANFDSLNPSAVEGNETFITGLDTTYLAELNKMKSSKPDVWNYCGNPTHSNNPASKYSPPSANGQTVSGTTASAVGDAGSFKPNNESIHRTVISLANLVFCPQIMYAFADDMVGPLLPGQNRVADVVKLRNSWIEMFGDYLFVYEQGREIRLAVDPTYGSTANVKIPDFSVAKTYVQRVPAVRSNAAAGSLNQASYPVELYYEIKAARFKDLTSFLWKKCEYDKTNPVPDTTDASGKINSSFWNKLIKGEFQEYALMGSRLHLNSYQFNADVAEMLLGLFTLRAKSRTVACEKLKMVSADKGFKDIPENDAFLDIYSIYWNYAEFVAFEQLLFTYMMAEDYASENLSTVDIKEPVLVYARKIIADAAGTDDIPGAMNENGALFRVFLKQTALYKEKFKDGAEVGQSSKQINQGGSPDGH